MERISFLERGIHPFTVGQEFCLINHHTQFHIYFIFLVKDGLFNTGPIFFYQTINKVP